jgi:pimeloyl-ACP methyl ester carboxylesterase
MALRSRPILRCTLTHSRSLSLSATNRLSYEALGDASAGESTLFLHGLLGNGKNLRGLAKAVNAPSSVLMDLRGHGKSPSFDGPHTFENLAMDVKNTLGGMPTTLSVLVGHSLGGRIALEYTHHLVVDGTTGSTAPPTTWLLDTVPGQANEAVERVLSAVDQVRLTTKREIVQKLREKGIEEGIALWLASSLHQTQDEGLQWGFDLHVARGVLEHFADQDFLGMLEKICTNTDTTIHLVRGGKNKGWGNNPALLPALDQMRNNFDNFHIHVLPKAGHWVHADDLKGLVQLFHDYR